MNTQQLCCAYVPVPHFESLLSDTNIVHCEWT